MMRSVSDREKIIRQAIEQSPPGQIHCDNLQIQIVDNEMPFVAAEILKKNKKNPVDSIYLAGNKLTDKSVDELVNTCLQLKNLVIVHVEDNQIKINGATKLLALKHKFRSLTVALRGNDIKPEELMPIELKSSVPKV